MNKPFSLLLLCLLILPACGIWEANTPVPAATSKTPIEGIGAPAPTKTPAMEMMIRPTATKTVIESIVLPTPTKAASAPSGSIARRHLVALSKEIGLRQAGSRQEAQAAEYIQAAFEGYGYPTQVQPFSFTAQDDRKKTSANVIAAKPGLSPREIIVGAHYDSTGDGQGADDNASGVAVMLQVAESLQSIQTPYTIRFIAFGAEEEDLDGSRYYVRQMSKADIQNTVGMINLDSLTAGDIAYVYGDAGAGSMRDWILKMARDASLGLETKAASELDAPDGTPCDCADYGPFQDAGIPFVYFEATNWNLGEKDGMTQVAKHLGQRGKIWHTRYDTLDYLDSTFPGRVDQHLNLFVTLLYNTLTQFNAPN